MTGLDFVPGDRVLVKLDDSDWQMGTVTSRDVTGHGSAHRRISSYYVNVNGLVCTVAPHRVKPLS
jgi:hypothetical protein